MDLRDATFTIGDWSKPHSLHAMSATATPDLTTVSCSCGWSVVTEANLAKTLGKLHLGRAYDKMRKS